MDPANKWDTNGANIQRRGRGAFAEHLTASPVMHASRFRIPLILSGVPVTVNPLTAGAAYIRVFIFISTLSTTF